jgi:hypothetical protein
MIAPPTRSPATRPATPDTGRTADPRPVAGKTARCRAGSTTPDHGDVVRFQSQAAQFAGAIGVTSAASRHRVPHRHGEQPSPERRRMKIRPQRDRPTAQAEIRVTAATGTGPPPAPIGQYADSTPRRNADPHAGRPAYPATALRTGGTNPTTAPCGSATRVEIGSPLARPVGLTELRARAVDRCAAVASAFTSQMECYRAAVRRICSSSRTVLALEVTKRPWRRDSRGASGQITPSPGKCARSARQASGGPSSPPPHQGQDAATRPGSCVLAVTRR